MQHRRGRTSEWFYIQQWRAKEEERQQQDALNSAEFKIGDLVKIAPWCKNKHRLAHVIGVAWYDTRNVTIQYMDSEGLLEEPSKAVTANLVLVSREEDQQA